MDRRLFLKLSSFFTSSSAALGLGAGLSACGGGGGAGGPAAWKFPQSIASADPRPDSIVLWTRVVPAAWSDTAALAADSAQAAGDSL